MFQHFPAYTIKTLKSRQRLTVTQREIHKPHEIGINDLLSEYFERAERNDMFRNSYGKQNFPTSFNRYEMTMGRNGERGGFFPNWSGADSRKFSEDKRNWLAKAIEEQKCKYRRLFSAGEVIVFNRTAEVYEEKEWPYIIKKEIFVPKAQEMYNSYLDDDGANGLLYPRTTRYTSVSRGQYFSIDSDKYSTLLASSFCHDNDIALVLKEKIVTTSLISDEETWEGSVRFYREVDFLLTRYSNGRLASTISSENFEPETTKVRMILSPGVPPGRAQYCSGDEIDKRLFTKLSSVV